MSGCQAPPMNAPLPRRLGAPGAGFKLGDGKSEIRNPKSEIFRQDWPAFLIPNSEFLTQKSPPLHMVVITFHVLGERRHRSPPLFPADTAVEIMELGASGYPVRGAVLGEERDRHSGGEV